VFLNDSIIRNSKPGPKPRKLKDGDGLYLLVQPTGARWWRLRYTIRGVEKALSLGVYPEITLKQARQRREEIRSKIANGIDPSQERKAEKRSLDITSEVVAREWWEKRKALWTEGYAAATMARL
jgi:hypothetical protein